MRASVVVLVLAGAWLGVGCNGDDEKSGSSPECPANTPEASASCGSVGLLCNWDARQCICGPDKLWTCADVDPRCPKAPPATGSACADAADAVCIYQEGLCFCSNDSTWTCP
jgi:hypothetical protein